VSNVTIVQAMSVEFDSTFGEGYEMLIVRGVSSIYPKKNCVICSRYSNFLDNTELTGDTCKYCRMLQ